MHIQGTVIETTGRNHVIESNGRQYKCVLRGKMRTGQTKSTNPVAVGDIVEIDIIDNQKKTGIITKIYERQNCIIRKSSNLSKTSHIIAANVSSVIVLFTLRDPLTTTVFLDRLLVAAESYDIPPVIVFNKCDIYNKTELTQILELKEIYEDVGYNCIISSVTEKINLEAVKSCLKDNTTVIVGHSGTGKSSMINSIEPGIKLRVGEISEYHRSGKHITTFARMIKLSFGGYIIDTPGIKGFGLVDIKKEEIYHFFPELFERSKDCKYYNCTHLHEPGCAVVGSVEKGNIAYLRYRSYLNMVLDDDDKHRQKSTDIF